MSMGVMGGFDLYFPNITPAALGDWTDGEIVQAVTEGVDKEGKPLFPIMPYGIYGKMAECIRCHTPMTNTGKPIEGMDLAGGNEFHLPGGKVVFSSNITPDLETGIGNWDRDGFIDVFRDYSEPLYLPEQGGRDRNTIMPWSFLAQMTEHDLGAIYDYLQTVKPVKNEVETWPSTP